MSRKKLRVVPSHAWVIDHNVQSSEENKRNSSLPNDEVKVNHGALSDSSEEYNDGEVSLNIKEVDKATDDKDSMKRYYFGCGPFHPKWLQLLANKKFFTLLMFVFILIQGSTVTGYTTINLSTLEKRYSFSSTLAAVYVVLYDVFLCGSIIFISYFGGRSHKPRFMGFSLIITSVGSLIVASPQLFFGSYELNQQIMNADNLYEECSLSVLTPLDVDSIDDSLHHCAPANIGAYVIFLIGQAISAIGAASAKTVAIAYIDEIVLPKYVPLHIGVVLISSILGPSVGYLLGSAFLSIYVDPWRRTELDPTDPAWVGAWWIGPLLAGVFGLIISTLFFMYPRWLPDSHLVRKERAKEMAKVYSDDVVNDDNLTLVVKQFPIHIKQLVTNASFLSTSFGLAALFIVRESMITFSPKYIESMFSLTAVTAGLLSMIAVVGAVSGAALGALFVYLWKPVGRQTAMVHTVIVAVSIPFVLAFLIKCPTAEVAGITVPYNDGSFDGKDSSLCSMNCSCQSSVYEPVCGDDGITYFSPCRAGCRTVNTDHESQNIFTFENCSCIEDYDGNVSTGAMLNSTKHTAVEGACDNNCDYRIVWFAVVYFILICLLMMIEIPYYHFTLRVVADEQRPLALGLQSAIYRLFGSIPGPLLFGAVIDLACVEWDYNCGIRGNCWIYDNNRLSLNTVLLFLPFSVVSVVLFIVGTLTYPTKKKQQNDRVNVELKE